MRLNFFSACFLPVLPSRRSPRTIRWKHAGTNEIAYKSSVTQTFHLEDELLAFNLYSGTNCLSISPNIYVWRLPVLTARAWRDRALWTLTTMLLWSTTRKWKHRSQWSFRDLTKHEWNGDIDTNRSRRLQAYTLFLYEGVIFGIFDNDFLFKNRCVPILSLRNKSWKIKYLTGFEQKRGLRKKLNARVEIKVCAFPQ